MSENESEPTSVGYLAQVIRERDAARAEVARREREHEALLETAQGALASTEAERDEARAEVARLNALLEIVAAENHARAQREARSLEEWASLRAEVEAFRAALTEKLLGRDGGEP